MYQPAAANQAAYQQALAAMQLQQGPFVPVTRKYTTTVVLTILLLSIYYCYMLKHTSLGDTLSHSDVTQFIKSQIIYYYIKSVL